MSKEIIKSLGNPIIYKKLALGNCFFGKAVFAAERIEQGQTILRFGGDIISSTSLPYPYAPEKDYFLQVGEDEYLGPSGGMDDYINHSCCPNCGIRISSKTVELIAIVSIERNAQLTYNYSTTMNSDWGKFQCACGAHTCCGIVRNFLELPVPIQKKYIDLGIVPNYILDKIVNI